MKLIKHEYQSLIVNKRFLNEILCSFNTIFYVLHLSFWVKYIYWIPNEKLYQKGNLCYTKLLAKSI